MLFLVCPDLWSILKGVLRFHDTADFEALLCPIEGRLDQIFFVSAPLTTRAADDRPPAVLQPSTVPMVLRYLLFLPDFNFGPEKSIWTFDHYNNQVEK